MTLLRALCRHRDSSAQAAKADDDAARLDIVKAIISLGQARINERYATVASFDSRATSVLSTAAVIMALVVATLPSWGRVWWVPLIGALITAGLAGAVFLRLREFDSGANLESFYNDQYFSTPLAAHLVMVQDIFEALRLIDRPLAWKRRFFRAAGATLVLTVVASVISLHWR